MKKIFIFSIITLLIFSGKVNAQTVYATIASGSWNAPLVSGNSPVWETYPNYATAIAATPGSGSPSTSTTNPSGTHNVLIRAGHTITMGDANRGCKSIIIQSGGKLWGSGNTQDRRFQIGQGGTGFLYPLVDTVQVDGALGAANDQIYIETGTATQLVKLYGNGTVDIKRIRTIGGSGSVAPATGGVMNFNIDMNINLWQSANYALSAVYNPTVNDNYTISVLPTRTVFIKATDGTFHNSQNSTGYGNYTYLIQGTIDLSANNQTTNSTSANIVAPSPATSKVSLYIDGGTLKLGTSFKADTTNVTGTTFASLGVLDFKLINGGVLDGTNTLNFRMGKTSDGAGGYRELVFATDATSTLKLQVAASQIKFGLGLNNNLAPNSAYLTNAGVPDVFTVALKGTIDNSPPTANVVNRQWTITEGTPGGTDATVALSWVTADQSAGFNPAQTVSILRWTGAAYEPHTATVTGTGTANDPYVATASGFVAFSPFIVANFGVLPITFQSSKAYQKNTGIQVEWSITNDNNADKYFVERSSNGNSFTAIGNVTAQNNLDVNNYTWFDANPLNGNNFYRIKGLDKNGGVKYTSVMKVNIGEGKPSLAISPNPVRGNVLNLQLGNAAKGIYSLALYNTAGQKIFAGEVRSEGGSSSQTVQLPSNVKPGTYNLQLNNADIKLNKTIVIE